MILFGIVVGLLLGAIVGRSLGGLFDIRLRWVSLIFLALALRIGTQVAIGNGVQFAADFRLPLYVSAFGLLAFACWLNRSQPGMIAIDNISLQLVPIPEPGGWTFIAGGTAALGGAFAMRRRQLARPA